MTDAINFTLVGTLSNTLVTPDSTANFTRDATISFTSTLQDDCQNSRTADSTILIKMINGAFERNCTADITGSCDIITDSNFPLGWYNISITSNKTGYNNGYTINESIFFLRSKIQLDAISKEPTETEVPWGQSPYNFSVNITNIDNESVTTYLWVSNSTNSWWIENQTTCTDCENITFKTSMNFTNNSIPGNIWYFKFNASSSTGYKNDSISQQQFNVTKNNIDLRIFGNNNSYVNRSSTPGTTINLSAVVWDSTLNQNTLTTITPNITLDEIHFYVYNGSSYVENTTEESRNETDYIRSFNPDCNYSPGQVFWNVSVTSAQAYTDNTTTGYNTLVVNIMGDLNATYTSPTTLQEYETGTNVIFSGNVTNDCQTDVLDVNVTYNITSGAESYLCYSPSSENPYTCTWSTTGKSVGNYNVTTITTKAYHNNNTDFETSAFKIKSTPKLTSAIVTPDTEGWSVLRNFTVNVTDNSGDTVTVRLWQAPLGTSDWVEIGSSKQCVTCSNTTLSWNTTYDCSDIETKKFKFNATDTEGNSYTTTGSDYAADDQFVLEESNV
ncbi:MAG: hypothetical protein KAS12_03555, partial [Candidatus Aenigmarchaeota archaeon]|nr:hypothetical protein [Candidatus Aenigmarchaeota archaeon]